MNPPRLASAWPQATVLSNASAMLAPSAIRRGLNLPPGRVFTSSMMRFSCLILRRNSVALQLCLLVKERVALVLKDLRINVVLVCLTDHSIVPVDRLL